MTTKRSGTPGWATEQAKSQIEVMKQQAQFFGEPQILRLSHHWHGWPWGADVKEENGQPLRDNGFVVTHFSHAHDLRSSAPDNESIYAPGPYYYERDQFYERQEDAGWILANTYPFRFHIYFRDEGGLTRQSLTESDAVKYLRRYWRDFVVRMPEPSPSATDSHLARVEIREAMRERGL